MEKARAEAESKADTGRPYYFLHREPKDPETIAVAPFKSVVPPYALSLFLCVYVCLRERNVWEIYFFNVHNLYSSGKYKLKLI